MEALLIILYLILIESVLSIDNAAVLAIMVKHLPQEQQGKALKYGIWGAFIFRGICLVLASWLVKFTILKVLGGLWLIWLFIKHCMHFENEDKDINNVSSFWGTVILVEIMDLSFSLDNIFAAVALTDNIYLIMTGVFIGILAMRFVAQGFLKLMDKYPSLTDSVYWIILLLGLKLVLSAIGGSVGSFIDSHVFDLVFTLATILIFIVPITRDYVQSTEDSK